MTPLITNFVVEDGIIVLYSLCLSSIIKFQCCLYFVLLYLICVYNATSFNMHTIRYGKSLSSHACDFDHACNNYECMHDQNYGINPETCMGAINIMP
jgi:hypothetical protein